MSGGVEFVEDDILAGGLEAEHFGTPGGAAAALFDGDGVVDGEVAGGVLGAGLAVFEERAAAAVVVGAGLDDFPEAPAEEAHVGIGGLPDDIVHEAEGLVHGTEDFEPGGDLVAGLGGELGGLPDFGVEEFDFVAAEALNVFAANAFLGLGEDVDAGAVGEAAVVGAGGFGEIGAEAGVEVVAEVVVHEAGLVVGAAEDAGLDVGQGEAFDEGGDGAELGFAAAAVGPDDQVAGMGAVEDAFAEVIEGGVVVRADGLGGDFEVEGGEELG